MLTNLTPASKAAGDMMNKLGLIVHGNNQFYDQSTGKMKSMADIQQILHDHLSGLTQEQQQFAIKTIFGQYALSGMTAIVNTAPGAFTKLTAEMQKNGEMDEILNEKKKGLGFQVQALQAHFATLQKEIGLALAPILVVLVSTLNKLMSAWQSLPSGIQKGIVIFGALAAVLLTIGGAVFTFIGTFGMFISSFDAAMSAFALIGTALAPVLIVVAALAVVFAVVYKSWQKDIGGIREYVQQFVAWFGPIWGKTIGKAKSDIESGLKDMTKGFTGWQRSIMGPVNQAMSSVWSAISSGMKKFVSAVSEGITSVTGWFKKMAPQFNEALHRIVAFLIWLTPLWKALWTALKFVVNFIFEYIVGIVQHFWGVFSGVIQLITDLINGKWKAVFQDLWQIVKNALLLALDLWGGALGKFFGGFVKIIERVGIFGPAFTKLLAAPFKMAESMSNALWKSVEKIFSGAIAILKTVLKGFVDAGKGIWEGMVKFWTAYNEAIWNGLKTAWHAGVEAAKKLLGMLGTEVQKVWTGIKMLFTKEPTGWWKSVSGAFKSGVSWVKVELTSWGEFIGIIFKNIKELFVNIFTAAWNWMKTAWADAISNIGGKLNGWWNTISDIFTKIKDFVQNAIKTALEFIKSKFQLEIDLIKTILNVFKTIVTNIFTAVKDLITGHSSQAMTLLQNTFKYGINAAKMILNGILTMVDGIFGGLPSKLLGWASKAMSEFSKGISDGIGWVRTNIDTIISVIGGALSALPGQMLQWAQNGMGMFVQGIQNGIGKIKGAVSSVGGAIKSILGMHSPAKEGPLGPGESDKWFPNMMNMFTKGVEDNKAKLQNAVKGVALGVQSTITGTQDHIHQFVNGSNTVSGSMINHNTNSQRQLIVNINMEGRSVQTDKQLAENIARQFRTQISMITG